MKSKKLLDPKFGNCYGTFTLDGKTCEYCWDPDSIPESDNLTLMEGLTDPTFADWLHHLGCGVCNGKFFTDFEKFREEFARATKPKSSKAA